jgi:DNA-binding PadR family transcriptional regulator
MLDLAILGLLEDRDLHGYELRRQLRDHLGVLANVSFGSLYPALARLAVAGAVEATEEAPARAVAAPPPPTGSLGGEWAVFRSRRRPGTRARRSRRVYRITDEGRRLFAELLAGGQGPDDARTFGLRWAFARHLAPQARQALLERRRAQLIVRLDELSASVEGEDLDPYARSVIEHAAEGIRQDVLWLDHLADAEEAMAPATQRTTHTGRGRPRASAAKNATTTGRSPR